jgi:hypothetical protein
MRNSTFDFILDSMRAQRDSAIAAVPEYEVVIASVPKLDPKTKKVVVDEDGVPVLVEKRLLKRDIVAAEWADKLKPHEEKAHDRY